MDSVHVWGKIDAPWFRRTTLAVRNSTNIDRNNLRPVHDYNKTKNGNTAGPKKSEISKHVHV